VICVTHVRSRYVGFCGPLVLWQTADVLRLLKRTALALAVMVVGLILLGLGVSAGAWVAVVGLVGGFLVNLSAPWPWHMGWRDYDRKSH
jgi:hypothetical protein